MLHVGLTGNIATGKSQASQKFAELGAHVIDADLIAHEILSSGSETYRKIVESFGESVLSGDGSINRKTLGRMIFFDPEKRLLLNRLTHPGIGTEIERRINELEGETGRGVIIIEAALMIEAGSYKKYHRLIVVTCSPSLQLSRLIDRDNLTVESAKARIESQMPMGVKLKLADYSIDTSGTLKTTYDQVEAVYRDLLIEEMQISKHN